jgi:hypothetical protein
MDETHIVNINKLKHNFQSLLKLQKNITDVRTTAHKKLQECKQVYNDLSKKNNKKVLLFCLDAFFFQYKTFTLEMEHLDKFRALLNNRVYCDYYKLNQLIVEFIKKNKAELDIEETETKSFPIYKELEPFQQYKPEDIRDIHNNILFLLNNLYNKCQEKYRERDSYNEKHQVGFTISNLINTLTYEINILLQQIRLYIDYLAFFHISQKKQMKRLSMKFSEFYDDMEANLQCTVTYTIDDIEEVDDTLSSTYDDKEFNGVENVHQWDCNNMPFDVALDVPTNTPIQTPVNTPVVGPVKQIEDNDEKSTNSTAILDDTDVVSQDGSKDSIDNV